MLTQQFTIGIVHTLVIDWIGALISYCKVYKTQQSLQNCFCVLLSVPIDRRQVFVSTYLLFNPLNGCSYAQLALILANLSLKVNLGTLS